MLYYAYVLRTLRPQDTSAPISRHFGKVWQANSRRIGLRRVHADPCVQDRVQLLRHITPIAQRASVDVTSGTTVAGHLAGVVAPGLWQRDARRSTWQPARQTTVCDECRCTTCLLCAEVRAHHPATPESGAEVSRDTSEPVPKCPGHYGGTDTLAPVPMCLGAELSWGRSVSSPCIRPIVF